MYVKTISGKTISIKCDKKQGIVRIKDEVERNTKIPKDFQHFVNQGKVLSEKKTIAENNIKAGATLDMTFTLQGGTKDD